MRETVSLSGVVLLSQPIGEYDKRLVILTRERGKITAFARGARRPKSPLIAVTNPFVFATFSFYEGRDAYTLVQAEAADYMEDMARSMPGVFYGYYFLELADYYGREGLEAAGMVNLLYVTLRALLREQLPPSLIRAVYELRLLVENGDYAPPEAAGELLPAALAAIRYLCVAPFARLYAFRIEETARQQVIREAASVLHRAVDKPLKSLAVIEIMG